jgi:hypothetical protein
MSKKLKLKLKLNWRFRLLLFIATFLFSFVLLRFIFKSELGFSLFVSSVISVFQMLTLFAGIDSFYLKKHFKNYHYQSLAYTKVRPFFYCPGRLVVFEDKRSSAMSNLGFFT